MGLPSLTWQTRKWYKATREKPQRRSSAHIVLRNIRYPPVRRGFIVPLCSTPYAQPKAMQSHTLLRPAGRYTRSTRSACPPSREVDDTTTVSDTSRVLPSSWHCCTTLPCASGPCRQLGVIPRMAYTHRQHPHLTWVGWCPAPATAAPRGPVDRGPRS